MFLEPTFIESTVRTCSLPRLLRGRHKRINTKSTKNHQVNSISLSDFTSLLDKELESVGSGVNK